MTFVFPTLFFWGAFVLEARAAVINALSCSQADVQAAINSASDGDIVAVPTGNCNWSGTVNIAKQHLIIQGAGVSQTIITASGQLFSTVGESANGLRVTAIEFRNCVQCFYFDGSGTPKEATKNFRIDHCKFKNVYVGLETDGEATGVLDHNAFEDSYGTRIYGSNSASATFPFAMGTSNAVFFEDNTIDTISTCQPHFIASNSGSRYVIRHNTFNLTKTGCGWLDTIDAHGYCEVAGRGSFTWEIYNNVFNTPNESNDIRLMHFRGGQGLVYGNSASGRTTINIALNEYAYCSPPCVESCSSYPCKDQINHTYVWNNTQIGLWDSCEGVVQNGRDYYETQMPGYSPYTYPHPLVGETDSPPSPPKNLRIR